MSLKFTPDRPRLPWQRKFGNFDPKLAITWPIQEIELRMLHQEGVFEVGQFAGVIEIYTRPPPVAMATKIGNFNGKMAKSRLIQEIELENLGILTQNWLERGQYKR